MASPRDAVRPGNDPAPTGGSLVPHGFDDLPGWFEDDHDALLRAFRASAAHALERPYRSRPLTPTDGFERVARASLRGIGAPRDFFEEHFVPHRILGGPEKLTGYYEPVLAASRTLTERFDTPLHRPPSDLVRTPDGGYGRLENGRVVPHHDRAAVMDGALSGSDLTIAYLDAVDAFIAHIQGSARLRLPDGTVRVTFAGKSGHRYTSLGRVLCERLRLHPKEMTADRLYGWLRDHPRERNELLRLNRSYIYFRVSEQGADGPVAAAGIPLVPVRSLAVDRTLHSFGLPFHIVTRDALPGGIGPLRRSLVAHDTGSAIVGPARGDIFMGRGAEAGFHAGRIHHEAAFHVLLPRRA